MRKLGIKYPIPPPILPIFVLDKDEKLTDIAEIKDSPIRDIAAKKLEIVRVYTFREHAHKVEDIIKKRIYRK